MAEFVANNHVNILTEITLFFADYGFHPRNSIESPESYKGAKRKAELLTADKIIARQEEMLKFLKDQLAWAQDKQMRYAN